MKKYRDKYGSIIIDQFFGVDEKLHVPFVRPRECFVVPSEKGKFETKYIRVNLSLDIETTTIDGHSAPYIMSMSLQRPDEDTFYIIHCKNWNEVQTIFDELSEYYGVGAKRWSKEEKKYIPYEKWHKSRRVLLCLIHNASFEFAFMRQELKFGTGEYDFFSKDSRKMMKATLENGIEFRDTLALTNSNLETLSNNYCKHKKIKDLDYSIPRNTKSLPYLPEDDMRYINDDVIILNEFENVLFDRFCMPGKKVPLTNTARLLLKVQDRIGIELDKVKDQIRKMQPSAAEVIEASRYLFRGGLVHGNIRYLNMETDCGMRDITSDYPYQMLTKKMPMGKFVEKPLKHNCFRKGHESEEFLAIIEKYSVIIDVTYYGLEAITDHSYESLSKVKNFVGDPIVKSCDNGRIRSATEVRVMQTHLDFKCYQLLYKWEVMEIHSFKFTKQDYLPEWLQKCVAEDYKIKAKLKEEGKDDTVEYALAKVDVNTYFGMACKSVYETNIGYDYSSAEWIPKEAPIEEIQKELDNRFLNFYWGVFICAWARWKLVDMICRVEAAGGHVVYYDTDSEKYERDEEGKVEKLFEEENARIREERKQFPLLADPCFWGKSGKGLGEWDNELMKYEKPEPRFLYGRPVKFKTLGAKRYLFVTHKGKKHLCVAGLPKKAEELLPTNPFEFFSINGFHFAGSETDKLRPVYIDEPYDVTITDPYGNTETIHVKTGVTLVPVDFEISEKKLYNIITQNKEFIAKRRGYLCQNEKY